ncbi:hypothetical protein V8E51_005051 [Hyaloscypha variabilis]
MHQPSFTKALAFFSLTCLGLVTLSATSPVTKLDTSSLPAHIPADLIPKSRNLMSRQNQITQPWPCGQNPQGCVVELDTCATNPGDPTIWPPWGGVAWDFAVLTLYNNNCNWISNQFYVDDSAFSVQPQGYALDSSLPYTVDIMITGDPTNPEGGNFNPYIWYSDFGMQEPMVNLEWLDYAAQDTQDDYNSVTLPFKCH